MLGQVYKVHTNSYSVKFNGQLFKCSARGILKYNRNEISVGDLVEFENGVINKIIERKNSFIRPNVANVDLIVAVISPQPKPDYYLLDKLIINAIKENTEVLIVVNKSDLDDKTYQEILSEYSNLNIEVISVCAKTGQGIDQLKQKLNGKLTVLAGQSAVGKTSLVNSMFSLDLKVGELSDKIQRGKHTTTRSEIFEYENIRLIDSPGFAVIDALISVDEICDYYPDFFSVSHLCKFRGCKHINEPDCKVKQLVNDGLLSKERYERYVNIYNELLERRTIYEKD